jgi:hypothetical protein
MHVRVSHSVVCTGSHIVSCITLSLQRSICSLSNTGIYNKGRVFAESIAANSDIALVDLEGVDLSPYVDVLNVQNELEDNRAILAHVHAQRIAQQRVKSAKGGSR